VVANYCELLRVTKELRTARGRPIVTVHNASMRGVGTKMGTVLCAEYVEMLTQRMHLGELLAVTLVRPA
jgi:hypothetical protein